ncbi:MAG: glycoside hydrolase family 130 protein [Ignavibacteriaceae bacterium]|nr:glycoside hydrolase family 130 protein [Ignavibacteriaceae bacterium]
MEIVKFKNNPVITIEDLHFRANSIFNPGAIKFNNEYLLLCRVELPVGRSSFVLARSNDGKMFKVDDSPCLNPEDHGEYNDLTDWGIEDPRIIYFENRYLITYTGYSQNLPVVMLAETIDFKKFKIIGPVSEPSNKDSSIFPQKINGYYWKMDRPSSDPYSSIWVNKSSDLVHWGGFRRMINPIPGTWAADKIGGSTPPVKTDEGWLFLFHGVRGFGISNIYKIGVMLVDIDKPWIVKGYSRDPILAPDKLYERVGDVQNVVFSNGWIVEDNGDVKIYYSGADTNICLAETSIKYLLSLCK